MDVVLLARLQFALTIGFHYLFPPLSIGLGVILVAMEARYLQTRNPLHKELTRFWAKIFGLIFAMGVATGIVMEFQFGTNWAHYSRYVGDVFGSALAAEGIFAFFMESGFLAIVLFGWDRVSPVFHFISTVLVALGSIFSAVWIVIANSWMQTPAGHHLVKTPHGIRAEIADFSDLFFNPSSMDRLVHVLLGCLQAGVWMVLSVSAFYLLQRKHEKSAKTAMRISLALAIFTSAAQLVSGHSSGQVAARYQPAKLAAMEGHYEDGVPASMHLFGWVDEKNEKVHSLIQFPGLLSFLAWGNFSAPATGLKAFVPEDRPPVNLTFQAFHAMVMIGMTLIALSLTGGFLWWRRKLFESRWLLKLFVPAVLLPQAANQLGWMTAEVGRQPWIVQGLLRTSEGVSRRVGSGEVFISIVLFSLIYLILFALFIFLLDRKIRTGPVEKGRGVLQSAPTRFPKTGD